VRRSFFISIVEKQSFSITLGVFILAAIAINVFVNDPIFQNLTDKAAFEERANQPELAEQTLLQIIKEDRFNIDNHHHYITTHFSIPAKKKVGNSYTYRDDIAIKNYYHSLSKSTDSRIADIGFYGNGLIAVNGDDYTIAIKEFDKVRNSKLKYLNNSIGNAYNNLDSTKQAEGYFRKEIENKGNLKGAYFNLAHILLDRGDTKEIAQLLNNKEAKKYFPAKIEQAIYFKSLQPINYFIILFERTFSNLNIWGLIAAFLIMGSWIMYLRKIDIFEVEKWRNIIFVVAMGMIFCFLTDPLSDFNNLIVGFDLNGNPLNDFFYCVIGIGAVEEFVKIIPLLIILRFSKIINEPFDYILYASLSALGFAFIENLIYFSEHNLSIIHGRALTAVVAHMFNSSIIAYGLVLNKYKRRKNPYLNFLFFFALAAISHGFYDFWLINKSASPFNILTFSYLLASMYMWNSFKNNALNQSAFYDKDLLINEEKIGDYLFYSLSSVLLFEYIALALKFGPDIANDGLISSIYSGTYLMSVLSVSQSKFNLKKGEWAPIKYWGVEGKINYDHIVTMEFKLNRFTVNNYAYDYLPNKGEVVKRLTVSNEPDWYLIKLDTGKQTTSFMSDTVIIRTKEKEEQISKGKRTFVAFCIIPLKVNLESTDLKRTDFKFCGWATVE
jgi:RsiW-degrading membrane proteinase PrsW (M82 family)